MLASKGKAMTKVKDLIAELQNLDPNAEVFVWVDGERYPINPDLDPIDWYVDINVEMEA